MENPGLAHAASVDRRVPSAGRACLEVGAQLTGRSRGTAHPRWETGLVITEHALLPVIPGREDEFEAAFKEARLIIGAMPGCRGLTLSRSMETPSTYLLLVEWESLDDHTIGFRHSAAYQQWRALLHHFYEPFPLVEHFQAIKG